MVTGELFQLHYDEDLEMLVTKPKPEGSTLDKYYESKAYISHTDTKRSLLDRTYQMARRYTLQKKMALVAKQKKDPGVLLDIGSGTGDFLVAAQKRGWQVFGAEPHHGARELAKTKGIDVRLHTMDFAPNSFDVITMWHVLEHVPDLAQQLRALKRLIKPTGTILIAVPNYKSFDAMYYGKHWAAYDVPRHLWHFSKKSIFKLFGAQDMKLHKILPMRLDAFYVSLLSEKHKTGVMNPFRAFWVGLRSNHYGYHKKEYSSQIYIIKNKIR